MSKFSPGPPSGPLIAYVSDATFDDCYWHDDDTEQSQWRVAMCGDVAVTYCEDRPPF